MCHKCHIAKQGNRDTAWLLRRGGPESPPIPAQGTPRSAHGHGQGSERQAWAQELQPDGWWSVPSGQSEKMIDDGAGKTALETRSSGHGSLSTCQAMEWTPARRQSPKDNCGPGLRITWGSQLITRDGHLPLGEVRRRHPGAGRRVGVPFYLLKPPPTLKLPL